LLQKNLILRDDQDLEYAIHFKSYVAVWQGKVLIETGIIKSYTSESVRINAGYVLRKLCEVRVI